MPEPREVVNRAAETVGDVLESAEDRRHAWPVAILGVIVTVACWVVGSQVALLPSPADQTWRRSPVLIELAFLLFALGGPFVATFATLKAIAPRDSEPTPADGSAFMTHQASQDASDRRRRIGLAAGVAGVLNAFLLYVLTGGLS